MKAIELQVAFSILPSHHVNIHVRKLLKSTYHATKLCLRTNEPTGQISNNFRKRLRLPGAIIHYDAEEKASKNLAGSLLICGKQATEGEEAIDCYLCSKWTYRRYLNSVISRTL